MTRPLPVQFNVQLPPALVARLRAKSKRTGLQLSWMVADSIRLYLDATTNVKGQPGIWPNDHLKGGKK